MNINLLSLSLIQAALLAIGQVLLKMGLLKMEPFGWNRSFWHSVLVNWQFALCGICYVSASVLWMYIIKNYPLSTAYPLVSLSFVFGMIAAMIFFHEQVDVIKWIGALMILAGCYLISR